MTNRTGQSAVQALSVSGIRETSPAAIAGVAVKYNPGWGVVDYPPYDGNDTVIRPGQINIINDLGPITNVKTFCMAFMWGGLQSGPTTFRFDILDAALELCQQNGKRLCVIVMWSWQTTSNPATSVAQGIFPAYLDSSLNGIHQSPTPGRVSADMFRADIMTEYLALHQALADRYNDNPWFEGVHTYDSAQQMTGAPGYSVGLYRDQLIRMAEELPTIWTKSGVFVAIDSGLSGTTNIQQVIQALEDNRCLMSAIDTFPIGFTGFTTNNVNGTNAQRVYQGIDGTKDFRSTLAWAGRSSPNNYGSQHLPTAAQYPPTDILDTLLLSIVRTNFDARYFFVPYKTTGFGTDLTNNQFWNTAAPGFTLYHPTFKEFLQLPAATIALNTTVPPNYGSVITGGT